MSALFNDYGGMLFKAICEHTVYVLLSVTLGFGL